MIKCQQMSGAMPGSGVGPLKAMYRAMEKAAFRDDGKQWAADNVLVRREPPSSFFVHTHTLARSLARTGVCPTLQTRGNVMM